MFIFTFLDIADYFQNSCINLHSTVIDEVLIAL